MTEIKYRAWCEVDHSEGTSDNKMVYFNPIECDNGLWFEAPDKIYHINEYHSIMQFTGLKDKNRKEIYEGDIVERSISGGPQLTRDKVYLYNGSFVIREGEWQKPLSYYCTLNIVGNIHENPELLNLQK